MLTQGIRFFFVKPQRTLMGAVESVQNYLATRNSQPRIPAYATDPYVKTVVDKWLVNKATEIKSHMRKKVTR